VPVSWFWPPKTEQNGGKGIFLRSETTRHLLEHGHTRCFVTVLSTFVTGSRNMVIEMPSKHKQTSYKETKCVIKLHYICGMGWPQWPLHCVLSFYGEVEEMVQENILVTLRSEYSEFILMYFLVQGWQMPVTHKMFRQSLVRSLVHVRMIIVEECQRLSKTHNSVSHLNGKPHFIDRKENGSVICVMCNVKKVQKEMHSFCKMCNKKLFSHPESYVILNHTTQSYFWSSCK
jgi:hypothetical protein